ncbi:uncharacterized protein LOC110913809 [Helianthus annuus]|uniref:uncharacterized protein LOC110913809 n=1 Tax=Helianthus annuus TaxID=4232 RepID=UPI000B8FC503|nr:uncharacterized protein LOC110913809 [Helianthus annuus]
MTKELRVGDWIASFIGGNGVIFSGNQRQSKFTNRQEAIRIKAIFKVHGILEALESGKKEAIPKELVFQVAQFQTAKKIWEALKTRYVGVERVREAKIEQLEIEFGSLRMKETKSIDSFVGRISQLVTKAASLGTIYEDKKLTRKLLGSVPWNYVLIVASIEQFADLKTMTFQDAISRLKTFEDRIKDIECLVENQECPDRMKKQDEANLAKTDDFDPSLFMMRCDQDTVFLNEEWVIPNRFETDPMEKDIWYLNNGASNHMTGNRAYFFELNKGVMGKMKFGDGSCIDIRGKRSVLLEGKTR